MRSSKKMLVDKSIHPDAKKEVTRKSVGRAGEN